MMLAACSTPAESATTTTTTPATTTTAAATTTTTEATTTTEPECVERDAVFFDSRGFVCPPHMVLAQTQFQQTTLGYRPGTYTTRVFEPIFSVIREIGFKSFGENTFDVSVDEPNCEAPECFQTVSVLSVDFVDQLQRFLEDIEWAQDLTSSPVEYWGYNGTQIDFTVDTCPGNNLGCDVPIAGISYWGYPESTQNRLLVIDVPGGPIGVDIGAHTSRFDQYWTEVAEPILASIEFSDG